MNDGYAALYLTIVYSRYLDPETAFAKLNGARQELIVMPDTILALRSLGLSWAETAVTLYPAADNNRIKQVLIPLLARHIRRKSRQHCEC